MSNMVTLQEDGINYKIFLPNKEVDYIQNKISNSHEPYEKLMLRNMRSQLNPGDVVLDIGANIGNHTLYLAAVAQCKVHAFEPNRKLCEALTESSRYNELEKKITIHNYALGSKPSSGIFSMINDENLGSQSVELVEAGFQGDTFEVNVIDHMDWPEKITLIKIDVEGFELEVLKGAKDLIARDLPLIYVESITEQEFLLTSSFLSEFGYSYSDTFNASPTHLYTPNQKGICDDKVSQIIIKKIRELYKAQEEIKILKEKNQYCNSKYRELTNQQKHSLSNVSENLKNANNKYRSACQRVDDLKAKITSSEKLFSLSEKELAVVKKEFETLKYDSSIEFERLKELLSETDKKNVILEKKLKVLDSEKVQAEKVVLDMRRSNTFKMGVFIKRNVKSPIGWMKIPVGLWRIYNNSLKKKITQPDKPDRQIAKSNKANSNTGFKDCYEPVMLIENYDETTSLYRDGAIKNSTLKVACIMDEFTYQSYLPECDLLQLTPFNWKEELENFKPEMLFIESAWRGKDDLWGSKVGHLSDEVKGIIEWCKNNNVPTMFWNKEDPVHFATFLNTAKLFDYIFTTDIDCIQRYKTALNHDNVYFLPFACQPLTNNPIEKYQRKNMISFAGAYYVKYPERTKDLDLFVTELPKFKNLEIFDRNYLKTDPNYSFPKTYSPYIVGTLPFDEIDKAYKGYDYALNLNSIKQSQSMFARRLYELLASNTITISNFSQGVRLLFGDLVVTTDDAKEAVSRLQKLAQTTHGVERVKLAALRKVMFEHTYQDRFDYIQEKIFDRFTASKLPSVGVVSKINTIAQYSSLIENVKSQEKVDISLLIVVNEQELKCQAESLLKASDLDGRVFLDTDFNRLTLIELFSEGAWVTYFAPDDYYGSFYLFDLALATSYSSAKVIGKSDTFKWIGEKLSEPCQLNNYRHATQLKIRSSILSPDLQGGLDAKTWLEFIEEKNYQYPLQLATDSYNYCLNESGLPLNKEQKQLVSDLAFDLKVNSGLALKDLVCESERIEPAKSIKYDVFEIKGGQLVNKLQLEDTKFITLDSNTEGVRVDSSLADSKHDYLYSELYFRCVEFTDNSKLDLHFDVEPGLKISIVLLYFDETKQRIGHDILQPNRNHTLELPDETIFIRFGLRVASNGQANIKSLIFGHKDLQPEKLFHQSEVLVLTNHYPSYDDLYRNGFVHSRAKAYSQNNLNVDVFRLREGEPISWNEYQNINVTTGGQLALNKALSMGKYKHILVHFLNSHMWEVLKDYIDNVKVTIWIHGAEVQPWYRRSVIYDTPDKVEMGKSLLNDKKVLWNKVFSTESKNLQFVFVSKYLMETTLEDYGICANKLNLEIIPNPINTKLFNYVEKYPSRRKRILSIRPYASKIYANDLAVEAIIELSKKDFFYELEFHLIGDGPLFEETLAPLRKFPNVQIEQKFLSRDEIASLHKDYGVFLCPSRMDTQGVSRDEAMASGLVPITNAVAAIPDFVTNAEGYLASDDDFLEIASAIESLVLNPDIFIAKSQASARCISNNRTQDIVTESELKIVN
ncbi:Methyltransferase FkbM family (fragment) [Vibrio coralliirubri]|uniref:FkbM family methyltransferase n=1 Tax=Vibrio coralliirubri TaxID=1516159 RepID=UPI000634B2ED